MSQTIYYLICAVLALLVIVGISMMSKVKTAVTGNLLSAFSLLVGILVTLIQYKILGVITIYMFILVGALIGYVMYKRVKMIQMPQMVALLNGVGGAASAIVGALSLLGIGNALTAYPVFSNVTASLALVVGMITLVGSLIAAGKLSRILPQKPVVWKNHGIITKFTLFGSFAAVILALFIGTTFPVISNPYFILLVGILFSTLFGYAFAIRVGGADMPITISLLNSLSGVAGAVAGMAIGHILLVAVGGIVGASGLFLTQIMCRAMNRNLMDILTGKTSAKKQVVQTKEQIANSEIKTEKVISPSIIEQQKIIKETIQKTAADVLVAAKSVIIVPGYGMALAQAQHLVKQLVDQLELNGAVVKYAIHPVAGRMPGHMNVLLAEADVSYEQLYEMDSVNDEFKTTDAVIVIGANDVLNPAARDAVDTPIYGMPILNVDQAKDVIICNFDLKPGYAGVNNPLYERTQGVYLKLGDAKETLRELLTELRDGQPTFETKFKTDLEKQAPIAGNVLAAAHSVIIVPGYGMALAQAQHLVKQLADQLEVNGAQVKYAIHPVAGRMPGHMNVLLAEADVSYEQLYEMDSVNDEFKTTDAVIVIGANDVLNPAARDAVDTPIYGMPILNVDQAKQVIICNFDLNPGYAGVNNPLYDRTEGVILKLGDAKETLRELLMELKNAQPAEENNLSMDLEKQEPIAVGILAAAHSVIIVPGYGMALAQAQHLVKQLADQLELNGAQVKYAIHPVAGRMPGHMNVLLAEADVSYEQLYEMDSVNDEFKTTDAVIVIGANDVLNPAARDAVDTPIYGMPILNVDQAKEIIICNFDLNPGYAGVNNPLYERTEGVYLKLGDAKESLRELLEELQHIQNNRSKELT
ncbi:MAG: NAD(P)(+) transhydrogenase (Re/Si-specific) subunit beta [Candidatus Saccharimonadaceae bacterium]